MSASRSRHDIFIPYPALEILVSRIPSWFYAPSRIPPRFCAPSRIPPNLCWTLKWRWINNGRSSAKFVCITLAHSTVFYQGLGGVLRDPGFGRNRARDSGIQKKPSRDSWILYWLWRGIFFFCSSWFVISTDINSVNSVYDLKIMSKTSLVGKNHWQTKSSWYLNIKREWMWIPIVYSLLFDVSVISVTTLVNH